MLRSITMVTIKDVAEKADVSVASVSRVLNDKKHISSETQEKVLAAVKELDYHPRQYRSKKETGKKIAIIFSSQTFAAINNPFYGKVLEGLDEYLHHHDYEIVVKILKGDTGKDDELIEALIDEGETAGVIVKNYGISEKLSLKLKESNIPIVSLDNALWQYNIDCIANDNINGAQKIINYLIELGHRKIAFMGGPSNHLSFIERYMGYKQALYQAGIELDQNLVFFSDEFIQYPEAQRILEGMKKKPTAIFCVYDKLALQVMNIVREMGYNIPGDISVAGFDNIDMADNDMASLTTVKIFKKKMGILTGKRLYELIEGDNDFTPIKQIIPVELIVRDSTGAI